ncbi:TIGR01548 family HAD-type hydrolase [Spirulina sp. CCNP1310]|uniref:TIGR01548 family HAD-type hydrolase n=1 Tax=Spirulina sp. CCNP1310 TaxID=3110249 RepID=UPI002B3DD6C3|nr:TIGR01548 family HAD-type hydrolase [Spirulina sp. CCNP1310]
MMIIFDIDGVIRDVGQSYRRALADTVEHYTNNNYRPTNNDIDDLKSEGIWNNDWEASQELIYRYSEGQGGDRLSLDLDYPALVDFFQSRYRGQNWDGYITTEPLLVTPDYFDSLTAAGIAWGFFSGATRGSAEYVLKHRLGLNDPILFAMEDGPGKPDPTGLFQVMEILNPGSNTPVFYAGDTVGDMQTVNLARQEREERPFLAIGILPPHIQHDPTRQTQYSDKLIASGAACVLPRITDLTPAYCESLLGV